MNGKCRDFIDSLYPSNRSNWSSGQIMDILVYYSSENCTIKMVGNNFPMIQVFQGCICKHCFNSYDQFVEEIGGDKE